MTDTHRYPAHVFWSDDDEGYIALATDLPGCSAFGDTQDEALRELQDAIAAWIEAQRSAGNPVPAPSSPAHEYSGKFLVRMPRSLHAKLSFAAESENTSLNQYIVYVLSSHSERSYAHTVFAHPTLTSRSHASIVGDGMSVSATAIFDPNFSYYPGEASLVQMSPYPQSNVVSIASGANRSIAKAG